MSQLYIGNIDSNTTIQDLVREFEPYGEFWSVKIPQTLSGNKYKYAFVEFKHRSDALVAILSWNDKFNWRVKFSHHSQGVYAAESGGSNSNVPISCFICGDFGHFVNDCQFAQSKVSNFAGVSVGGGSGTGVYLPSNCDGRGGFGDFSCDYASENGKDIKNKAVKLSRRIRLKKNKVASAPKRKPLRPPSPPWLELPEEITEIILRKLGPVGILWAAQYVCTTWRKICRDPTMWRVIDMWKLGDVHSLYSLGHMGLEDVFTLAVDLSQGQAMEINMGGFGCDHYLKYIAERCSDLRCLRLAFCDGVSGRTLSKAVKRFPLLEELHLHCVPVRKRFVEAIGQTCPMLKKFALNRGRGYEDGVLRRKDDALAIAKSMPELHHLQLFGNRLTNEVLDAILNGCPKLESLDLRHCFNLNIEGEPGKRCAQQIKSLWRPHDPTHNYEWLALSYSWEKYYRKDLEYCFYSDDDNLVSNDEYYSDDDDYDSDDSDEYDSDNYEDDDLSDPDEFDEGTDESDEGTDESDEGSDE